MKKCCPPAAEGFASSTSLSSPGVREASHRQQFPKVLEAVALGASRDGFSQELLEHFVIEHTVYGVGCSLLLRYSYIYCVIY